MPTISLTLPVAGTTITAGLHATNYNAIQALVNGGLDTANWASGLIFAPSKFMQEGATKFQGLRWNGSGWVPADTLQVYARGSGTVDVNNTAAETTLFPSAITITGGDMGTNRILMILASGDYLHNNVAADTLTLRLKLGGTTLCANTSNLGNAISATRQGWHTNFVTIANQNANNVQTSGLRVSMKNIGGASADMNDFANTSAIDTSVNQALDFTAQWSAASVNNSFKLRQLAVLIV